MNYLRFIWLWIRNSFTTNIPALSRLAYASYVIEDKGYFIFSWEMRNAHRLKIKSIRYQSTFTSGSAYIYLPEHINRLEIIISGSWRKQKYSIELQRLAMDYPIDFPAMVHRLEPKLIIPIPKPKILHLKIHSFKAEIVGRPQIKKIINITYPN